MSADVARAGAAVDAAAQEHREADAAHRMASQMARGPQHDDFLEALTHLLEGHQGEVLVLDDPLSAVGSGPREDLLQLIAAGSANRPLILLTDDPDVLGWAIEQPADVAAAVPAGALVSDVTNPPHCAGPRAGRSCPRPEESRVGTECVM